MRSSRRRGVVAAAWTLGLPSLAVAHERDFTLSRDWHLPFKGEHEIESRTRRDRDSHDVVQQFEFEYGVLDQFAVEPGVKFLKQSGENIEIDAAELELRFNCRDFGYDKLLPALNVEGERSLRRDDDPLSDEPRAEIEIRSIVSWYTVEGEDFTANLNFGRGFSGGDNSWESELTAGYMRPIDFWAAHDASNAHPLRGGFELVQQLTDEHELSAGPTITFRATKHLHLLATAVFALSHRSDRSDEFRLLLEWEF